MDINRQKEVYIKQASRIALGERDEPNEATRAIRIRFWQSLTGADRFAATTEIVRRVHIAKGGSQDDLRVERSVTKLGKTKVDDGG